MHRAVLGHLMMDPDGVTTRAADNARRRLSRSDYPGSPKFYYEEWLRVLDNCVEATAKALLEQF